MVAIIGLLVAILIPAVLSARESARVRQCADHLKNLAEAAVRFDMAQGRFPGYADRVPGYADEAGWPVLLLDQLDRKDLWTAFRDGTADDWPSAPRIASFVCPSDPEAAGDGPALSYAANCGQPDGGEEAGGERFGVPADEVPPDWQANGVFFRRHTTAAGAPANWVKVALTADDIKDGARQTFLISECYGSTIADVRGVPSWSANPPVAATEKQFGFLWSQGTIFVADGAEIGTTSPFGLNTDTAPRVETASGSPLWVPTGYHPSGVNMAYCDGHVVFIDEGVNYEIYALQMTPHGSETWQAGVARSDPAGEPPDWCRKPLPKGP
ncbi:MAG: DUF1559 domain-containing protein [Pirellulales bacterium]|nr:DUF1559 domain-containing protein [Pirellulales bacterium]